MAVGAVARGGRTAQTSDCTCPTSQRGRRLVFASLLQMLMGGGMIGIAAGVLGFGSYRPTGPIADARLAGTLLHVLERDASAAASVAAAAVAAAAAASAATAAGPAAAAAEDLRGAVVGVRRGHSRVLQHVRPCV